MNLQTSLTSTTFIYFVLFKIFMSFSQGMKDISRLQQVIGVMFQYEFGYFISQFRLAEHLPLQKRLEKHKFLNHDTSPSRVTAVFEELGGTFVKLGQLLSLRPDLIPKEYCDEFSKLQDNVKPFPAEEARKIIESELKKPLNEVFKHFDDIPLAAASIGQVHKAQLLNGHYVAVKVQRPGISEQIKTDIDILHHIAEHVEKHYPALNPVEIVKEFEKYSENELDYNKEAKNVDKFHKNFANQKKIKVPMVYFEYCTSKVLTLEFIDGKKLSELTLSEHEKKKIIHEIVNSLFKQIFIDGIFHADLHPGNIFILENDTIAFLDFGIVGRFSDDFKDKTISLFSAMINGDLNNITDSLLSLGVAEDDVNEELLRDDLHEALGEYYGTTIQQVNITEVFQKLITLAKKHNLKLPVNFVLLGKALITVEGFATGFDPQFNIVKEAQPFVKSLAKKRMQPRQIISSVLKTSDRIRDFIIRVPDQASTLISRLKDQDFNVRRIHTDLQSLGVQLTSATNRLVLGLVITGLLIASGFMMQYNQYLIAGISALSFIGFCIAGLLIIMLLVSIFKKR